MTINIRRSELQIIPVLSKFYYSTSRQYEGRVLVCNPAAFKLNYHFFLFDERLQGKSKRKFKQSCCFTSCWKFTSLLHINYESSLRASVICDVGAMCIYSRFSSPAPTIIHLSPAPSASRLTSGKTEWKVCRIHENSLFMGVQLRAL